MLSHCVLGKIEVLLWPSPAGGTPSSANQVSSTVKTRSLRCSYPVEVLEVELLEDGISAFHLVPPHGSQVRQQLLPLLRAQPVGFSCLPPGKGRGAGQHGRGKMKQIPPQKWDSLGFWSHGSVEAAANWVGGMCGCADLNP